MSTSDLRLVPQNLSLTTETSETRLTIHMPFSERIFTYQ